MGETQDQAAQSRIFSFRSGMLAIAVLASGAASLMYQVAWTRRLASVTSATVTAQATVLAVFMAGLGAGAWLAGRLASQIGVEKRSPQPTPSCVGRWVARLHFSQPILGYAVAELGAVLFALISLPAIGVLDWVRVVCLQMGASAHLALAAQLTAVAGFLFFPTVLMGASLPFVVEHLERALGLRALADKGKAIGLFYALNTLGALVGCFVAGFITLEKMGLSKTVYWGAALGCVAVLLAFAARDAQAAFCDVTFKSVGEREREMLPPRVLLASALAGFVGLGAEVLWTRLLSLVVLNTVYAFTQVLAAVLAGIALGGMVVAFVSRAVAFREQPVESAERFAAWCQVLAACCMALVPVALLRFVDHELLRVAFAAGNSLRAWFFLIPILVFPALWIATTLPLLVMVADRPSGSRAFGELYAWNTVGAVVGSLVTGFWLLPQLGTAGASRVLQGVSLALALLLATRTATQWRRSRWVLGLGTFSCVLLSFSVEIPEQIFRAYLPEGSTIREIKEGTSSSVMITDDSRGVRSLWINSAWVATTGGRHEMLGHLPALFVAQPRQALGIALGTGQTFAAVLRHGASKLYCVEIDAGVIELSRRWFAAANHGLLDLPQVVVRHDDGRAFLRATPERFDVIVLEPLQAWSVGTSNLYSRNFYAEARARLNPGGVLAQWIPFYGQGVDETRAMVRAALEEFPEASLWLDGTDGILLLHAGEFSIAPSVLTRRIQERQLVRDLAEMSLDGESDLLAMFLMGPHALRAWTQGVAILDDDHPFLEFAAARKMGVESKRAIHASIAPLLESSRSYAAETDSSLTVFGDAQIVRDTLLSLAELEKADYAAQVQRLGAGLTKVQHSRLLRNRYRTAVLAWASSPQAFARGEKFVREIYRRALLLDPELGESMLFLAQEYLKQGWTARARALLEKARFVPGVEARAQALLAKIEAVH